MSMIDSTTSLPHIGTYWYGSALGPLERACLISMLDQGHKVTLFCHGSVDRVPEGVEIMDAREVTGNRQVIMYLKDENKSTHPSRPALFSNLFRYHMIAQLGWTWLDLDCFLLKPLQSQSPYIFAWEDSKLICNATLALPKSSSTLKNLLEFCGHEYPIPPFFPLKWKLKLHFRKVIGNPIHVSYQKWGVWGPRALTYFLKENKEDHHALDTKLLYPIHWKDVSLFHLPSDELKESYLKDAMSVHLWGSKIKKTGLDKFGPEKSFLKEIMRIGGE
ncbi:MAG: hypothetical protein F4X92_04085 [Gammaproteobacteria bacterium]|nr:hypothetical protein [Gammaproteobacteria bacterium]